MSTRGISGQSMIALDAGRAAIVSRHSAAAAVPVARSRRASRLRRRNRPRCGARLGNRGRQPMTPRPYPTPAAIPARAEAETPKPLGATVAGVLDTSLIPGRSIEPIDLPNALRLAGVRELDIAIARRRVNQSIADLQYAWAQWLPSLFLGPTWYRADGQVQTVNGPVENVNRSSLFIGGVAATTAPGYAAASPGTGYIPLNGSSAVFRFSDAIYMPIAAQRVRERQQGRSARRK